MKKGTLFSRIIKGGAQEHDLNRFLLTISPDAIHSIVSDGKRIIVIYRVTKLPQDLEAHKREVEGQVIKRALILAKGVVADAAEDLNINPTDLRNMLRDHAIPFNARRQSERHKSQKPKPPELPVDLSAELHKMERAHLIAALKQSNGSQTAAGELLGLPRSSLQYKMKAHKIDIKKFRQKSPPEQ